MATMLGVPFERHSVVRIALAGCGGRGRSVLGDFLKQEGVECVALFDVIEERTDKAKELAPAARTCSSYLSLLDANDIDLVIVASPWAFHVPMAVQAMQAGFHVAVEVPCAVTVEECWELVETSEQTRKHCCILENCCYGQNELTILNMVRAGVFGELTHGEAAYIHDLRTVLFDLEGEGAWRRAEHITRDGNLYPTHGLGPVCWYMNIHRGDRLASIVSMSSKEVNLSAARGKLESDDSRSSERYVCGDMNTSILRTVQGKTILLQHDVVTPRPYSRLNSIFGSRGGFADFPARIYVEGESEGHGWADFAPYKEKFAHPLWEVAGEGGGHGGMDGVMAYRLVQCMREGLCPDMDVYDAAAWSVPGPLSEASVKAGGAPQQIPDFTKGAWCDIESGIAAPLPASN